MKSILWSSNMLLCGFCNSTVTTHQPLASVHDPIPNKQRKRGHFMMRSATMIVVVIFVLIIFKSMTVTLSSLRFTSSESTLLRLWFDSSNIFSTINSSLSVVLASVWLYAHPSVTQPDIKVDLSSGEDRENRHKLRNTGIVDSWSSLMKPSINPQPCNIISSFPLSTDKTIEGKIINNNFNHRNGQYAPNNTQLRSSVKYGQQGNGKDETATANQKRQLNSVHTIKQSPCNENPPLLYNILTNGKVYYDGGQWFHMAESLLLHFGKLRRLQRLVSDMNSSIVYYNFDQVDFHKTLNPFTRLIVLLSTKATLSLHPQKSLSTIGQYYFLGNPILAQQESIRVGQGLLLSNEMLMNAEMMELSPTFPTNTERFRNIKQISNLTFDLISSGTGTDDGIDYHGCVRYMGSIGGITAKRGRWFHSIADIHDFRDAIRYLCPRTESLISKFKKQKKYKLLVYQRDKSRLILNIDYFVGKMKEFLPQSNMKVDDWEFHTIIHDNERSPCELSHMLHDVDVLVTVHGFQSMLLLFLPLPSILFELFPSNYFKRVYKLLGQELGIVHGYAQALPTTTSAKLMSTFINQQLCMELLPCRVVAREQDLKFHDDAIQVLIQVISDNIQQLQDQPVYDYEKEKKASKRDKRKYLPVKRDKLYT